MSNPQLSLGKYEKELLVFGFTKNNYKHNIPVVIKQLFGLYFDEIIYIKFNGNELEQFLNSKPMSSITKSFTYNNMINILCEFFPSGRENDEKDIVLCYIRLEYQHSNIAKIRYDFSIQCKQTNSYYQYRGYDNHAFSWSVGCMRLSDIKKIKDLKELLFEVYVNINYIEYIDDTINFIKPFKIKSHTSYKWIISEELLNKFKSSKWGQSFVCDILIDDCWDILCYPNGDETESEGDMTLYVTLIKQPIGLKKIFCKLTIKSNKINEEKKCIEDDIDYANYPSLFEQCFIKYSKLSEITDSLEIEFDLKITKLINHNDDIVPIPQNGFISHDIE